LQLAQPDTGTSTLIAVTLGAILATLGGVVATQLENRVRKRERERNAALLFGEILSTLELILKLADDSRARGAPYGPLTMRMVAGARREMDIYDRNREALYDLSSAATRVKIHGLAIRIAMALDGVLEATPEIAAVELTAKSPGLTRKARDEIAERLDRMRASRAASFDFALEMAEQIKPVVGELGALAKHSFEGMTRAAEAV
jgi:hypothetical protein